MHDGCHFQRPSTAAAQDGAIKALVAEKLRGKWLFVSVNVVNHPLLLRLRSRLGALLPFQPPTSDQKSVPEQPTLLNASSAPGLEAEQTLRKTLGSGGS